MTNNRLKARHYAILDIDGVFNPYMATDLIERQFIRYQKEWIDWHLDIVNHAAWVRELEEYADIVWGSNWGDESNALAGWFHLGQTSYPHIPLATETVGMDVATWKLPAISQWIDRNVKADQKVLWVEDEIAEDARLWVNGRPNVLLLEPDPAIGLTLDQFQLAKQFLSC